MCRRAASTRGRGLSAWSGIARSEVGDASTGGDGNRPPGDARHGFAKKKKIEIHDLCRTHSFIQVLVLPITVRTEFRTDREANGVGGQFGWHGHEREHKYSVISTPYQYSNAHGLLRAGTSRVE